VAKCVQTNERNAAILFPFPVFVVVWRNAWSFSGHLFSIFIGTRSTFHVFRYDSSGAAFETAHVLTGNCTFQIFAVFCGVTRWACFVAASSVNIAIITKEGSRNTIMFLTLVGTCGFGHEGDQNDRNQKRNAVNLHVFSPL